MALEMAPDRTTTRLVQLQSGSVRRVARVDEPSLRVLADTPSVVALANEAIRRRVPLTRLVDERVSSEVVDYDAVYSASSPWRLLVPIDHPEPSRCLVSGTGLTHYGSAVSRDRMHAYASESERGEGELTDSMRMFRMGLDGGRPERGKCGVAPEWFYKGNGTILRACGDILHVPGYAEDGGEEAEVAGVYIVDPEGRPWRIGMAAGNEFSDHKFEKRNYLNLAGSKLRTCALGPEIVIDADFERVSGRASIERSGRVIWQRDIATGEQEMCHSVANIEHHHFKFEGHRRPGDVHVHYFGAHSLSFVDDIQLEDGDVMSIQFAGFGRALRNPVGVAARVDEPVTVQSIA
jgi:hypothetical protein